jgi:hypothetical protein
MPGEHAHQTLSLGECFHEKDICARVTISPAITLSPDFVLVDARLLRRRVTSLLLEDSSCVYRNVYEGDAGYDAPVLLVELVASSDEPINDLAC